MDFTKSIFALALGSVGMMGAMSAHAFAMNVGDTLSIQAPTFDGNGYVVAGSGSFFAMDLNGDGLFRVSDRIALSQGTTGLVIGTTTTAGPSHYGLPTVGEMGSIDAAWGFLGNTGSDFLVTGVTGDTVTGLDFSGWRVTWNGIPSLDMGGGLQDCETPSDGVCVQYYPGAYGQPGTSVDYDGVHNNGTGIATFAWDGVYGHAYTIDYLATVPKADPYGFGGVGYLLHLQGVVAVPEASTYGMLLAGLGLVGFAARRRNRYTSS